MDIYVLFFPLFFKKFNKLDEYIYTYFFIISIETYIDLGSCFDDVRI